MEFSLQSYSINLVHHSSSSVIFLCTLRHKKMTKNSVLTPLYQKQQRISLLISDQQFSLRRIQKPTSLQKLQNCYHSWLSNWIPTSQNRNPHDRFIFIVCNSRNKESERWTSSDIFHLIPNVYYVLNKIQSYRRKTFLISFLSVFFNISSGYWSFQLQETKSSMKRLWVVFLFKSRICVVKWSDSINHGSCLHRTHTQNL